MNLEERVEAIEHELAALREARRTDAVTLQSLHTKALPGLDRALQQLETAMEAAMAQQAHLTEQFGTHAQWFATHSRAIADLDARLDQQAQAAAERGAALDARIDKLAQAAAERGAALDARIDKLVSAIGKLLNQRP